MWSEPARSWATLGEGDGNNLELASSLCGACDGGGCGGGLESKVLSLERLYPLSLMEVPKNYLVQKRVFGQKKCLVCKRCEVWLCKVIFVPSPTTVEVELILYCCLIWVATKDKIWSLINLFENVYKRGVKSSRIKCKCKGLDSNSQGYIWWSHYSANQSEARLHLIQNPLNPPS